MNQEQWKRQEKSNKPHSVCKTVSGHSIYTWYLINVHHIVRCSHKGIKNRDAVNAVEINLPKQI